MCHTKCPRSAATVWNNNNSSAKRRKIQFQIGYWSIMAAEFLISKRPSQRSPRNVFANVWNTYLFTKKKWLNKYKFAHHLALSFSAHSTRLRFHIDAFFFSFLFCLLHSLPRDTPTPMRQCEHWAVCILSFGSFILVHCALCALCAVCIDFRVGCRRLLTTSMFRRQYVFIYLQILLFVPFLRCHWVGCVATKSTTFCSWMPVESLWREWGERKKTVKWHMIPAVVWVFMLKAEEWNDLVDAQCTIDARLIAHILLLCALPSVVDSMFILQRNGIPARSERSN